MHNAIKISVKLLLQIVLLCLLSVTAWGKDYRGGELRTSQTFRYGRFEVHMRSAPHSGVISSFFTFHDMGAVDHDEWNEIDVEFLGRYQYAVQFNTITGGIVGHEHSVFLPYNPAQSFHTYAFEWTPDYVSWFVDGAQFYSQTGDHIAELNRFHKLMMNLWQSESVEWAGAFNEDDLPLYAFYDWVKYYSYVPGEGDAGTNNDFMLLWEDNFESWDTDRWTKTSGTWDGNNVDFIPANVVFQDGFMILCMTTPGATGYDGPALPVDGKRGALPTELQLSPAWPNPFNGQINIKYETDKSEYLAMTVYDISGNIVKYRSLADLPDSDKIIYWDGRDNSGRSLESGSYIIKINTRQTIASQKVVLLK